MQKFVRNYTHSSPDLKVSSTITLQPFISFTNRVKRMSYCSSVSDQGVEEDEGEPEPPQPFEGTEDQVAALQTGPEHP